jgi:hypothetical protein
LEFLRQIEKNVPPDLEVHVIVDNYATHKHPRVKRWLAADSRQLRAVHFGRLDSGGEGRLSFRIQRTGHSGSFPSAP